MNDLVKRLRDKDTHSNFDNWLCLTDEAADRIEELKHDLEESRNEQKLSESWRTAWAKRALKMECEQEKLIEVLHKCTLHLEQEAEAECVDGRWQANDAMMLCSDIDELFASQPLPPANADVYRNDMNWRSSKK